jgi:prepilin-type N-terminal cleavage/methylation domain-containing protein
MRKKFKYGFTFLEIMIGIGIFGIVASACLTNYLLSIKNIKIANDKIEILILAQQKIEELKIRKVESKEERGNFSEPYSNYIWRIELSDIVISDTYENIEMKPYKLIIEGPNNESYSTILPILKDLNEKNE